MTAVLTSYTMMLELKRTASSGFLTEANEENEGVRGPAGSEFLISAMALERCVRPEDQ
jgi:hypothetical protein